VASGDTAAGDASVPVPDAQGHDAQGHDAQGHDAQGHDAQGHDAQGHDAQGHDAQGHDAQGHDLTPPDMAQLDGASPDLLPGTCAKDADCDDGLACTTNSCVAGSCVTKPKSDCPWPAEPALQATNLTHIEGPLVNDFHKDLSGAVWDPDNKMLWVCRNTASDSRIWAIEEDGKGSFQIAYKGGKRGEWSNFGDLEGLTLASPKEPETLYLIVEGVNRVKEYDLSTYGTAVLKNDWNTGAHMPQGGGANAEGITFVPDAVLKAQGFVDAQGKPRVSARGMGGLMLVGHQLGGAVYVFDLDRKGGKLDYVGSYQTAATETAGLELDRSTGLLYLWHGAGFNTLEVARLSSTATAGGKRQLDTVKVYKGPAKVPFGTDNHEGIAIMPASSCKAGKRGFFLTTDGGGFFSLLWYKQFPCT
jgi:hypothetical protein